MIKASPRGLANVTPLKRGCGKASCILGRKRRLTSPALFDRVCMFGISPPSPLAQSTMVPGRWSGSSTERLVEVATPEGLGRPTHLHTEIKPSLKDWKNDEKWTLDHVPNTLEVSKANRRAKSAMLFSHGTPSSSDGLSNLPCRPVRHGEARPVPAWTKRV